jgi:hypothetical protein
MTGQLERRTFVAEVPLHLRHLVDLKDDGLREAQFRYSRTVMAGSRADFRVIDDPIHETEQ